MMNKLNYNSNKVHENNELRILITIVSSPFIISHFSLFVHITTIIFMAVT